MLLVEQIKKFFIYIELEVISLEKMNLKFLRHTLSFPQTARFGSHTDIRKRFRYCLGGKTEFADGRSLAISDVSACRRKLAGRPYASPLSARSERWRCGGGCEGDGVALGGRGWRMGMYMCTCMSICVPALQI